MNLLSKKIGIDLGTSTVLIYVKGEGIVVNEPSLVAVNRDGTRILAIGRQALAMVGRTPDAIQVVRPMREGVIATYLKRKHNLLIGERTAEDLKISAGSAVTMKEPLYAEVRGRDLVSGLPRSLEVSSNEVVEAIQEPLRLIVGAVRAVLEETPPELAADIFDRGIVLSGGGSQLRGLDRYIAMHTGIPTVVADEPQTSVVRGTGLALENFEVLKRNQSYLR